MPTMERASITTLFYLLWNKKKMGAHQSPGRNLLCQGGCKAPIVGWMDVSIPYLSCPAHTPTHFDLCISSPGSFDTVTMISLFLIYHDL